MGAERGEKANWSYRDDALYARWCEGRRDCNCIRPWVRAKVPVSHRYVWPGQRLVRPGYRGVLCNAPGEVFGRSSCGRPETGLNSREVPRSRARGRWFAGHAASISKLQVSWALALRRVTRRHLERSPRAREVFELARLFGQSRNHSQGMVGCICFYLRSNRCDRRWGRHRLYSPACRQSFGVQFSQPTGLGLVRDDDGQLQ